MTKQPTKSQGASKSAGKGQGASKSASVNKGQQGAYRSTTNKDGTPKQKAPEVPEDDKTAPSATEQRGIPVAQSQPERGGTVGVEGSGEPAQPQPRTQPLPEDHGQLGSDPNAPVGPAAPQQPPQESYKPVPQPVEPAPNDTVASGSNNE